MSFPIAFIVTIVNTKTKKITGVWLEHPEQVDEVILGDDEVMYVNDFGAGKHDDNDE